MRDVVSDISEGVVNGVSDLTSLLGRVSDAVRDYLEGFIDRAWDKVRDVMPDEWVERARALFDWLPFDPLVIDLDGDGIELSTLETSEARFDLDGDGFRERTDWVVSDDGFLVIDRNGNGDIDDITELFGSPTSTGFEELSILDTNTGSQIDANDEEFVNLQIWRDFDQDGEVDVGQLQSLDDTGVVSTSLDSIATSEIVTLRTHIQ